MSMSRPRRYLQGADAEGALSRLPAPAFHAKR
jgi:hypothetical protein